MGAGWEELSGGWLLVRAVALRGSASSRPKGPVRALLAARGSDLPVLTCRLLVTVCTPLFLPQAPDGSSPRAVELCCGLGGQMLFALCARLCKRTFLSALWRFVWMDLNLQVHAVFALV